MEEPRKDRVLSLDLSTKTGWALLSGPDTLEASGVLHMAKKPGDYPLAYPLNYVAAAKDHAWAILCLVNEQRPTVVVVEETTPGHETYSHKILEFIHFAVAEALCLRGPIYYLRTGEWRRAVGLQLTKEQAKANLRKNLDKAKREASAIRFLLKQLKGKLKHSDHAEKLRADLKALRMFRTTRKHLAVEKANSIYGLKLIQKENDQADAILIGRAFCLGATRCDGKPPTSGKKIE